MLGGAEVDPDVEGSSRHDTGCGPTLPHFVPVFAQSAHCSPNEAAPDECLHLQHDFVPGFALASDRHTGG